VISLDINAGEFESIGRWVKCDIGSDQSVTSAFAELTSSNAKIDILINNAGIGATGTVETSTTEEWNKVLNINVIGTSRVSAAALPFLRKSAHAAIVNTCSVVANFGFPKRSIYSASKGAILALTLSMASDFLKENIRVNCVNPSTTDTPWIGRLLSQAENPEQERAALEARQPTGRLVTPEEVANAIIYLAHPQQKSTTGTVLAIDGGLHSVYIPK
jgi:NAD(P)-dependent dehydrogenase (short-subunit alcohol dehydrogenase family)